MAYSINSTIKHGKYTEKIDSTHLQQVYLETGDTQVLTEAAVTIGGTTYPVGTQLSTLLGALGNAGGQYKIVAGATADVVKIQVSNDGGTTWEDVSSVTVNKVSEATYATKIGTSSSHPSVGSATQPVYVDANGAIQAATAYASASVLQASQDGSGNDIVSTYATKQELEDAVAGVTSAYVITANEAKTVAGKTNKTSEINLAKTASGQTVTISGTLANLFFADYTPGDDGVLYLSDLKVGDTIYLTDQDKCDWFVGSVSSSSITLYSIEADTPVLTGYVTASGSLTANKIILGNGSTSLYASNVAISTTGLASNSAGVDTNVLTEKAVATTIDNRIGALDVSNITGFGAGKTLSTLTETDGKISATFQDISIGVSQITDFPSIPSVATGSAGQVYGWDGSGNPEAQSIYAGLNAAGTSMYASRTGANTLAMPTMMASAGTYGAVQVNAQGFVIAGGQTLVFASSLSDTKLDALVNGGCGIIYED